MTVYLVVFDRAAYDIGGKLFADIAAYIDDVCVSEHSDSREQRYRRAMALEALPAPLCGCSHEPGRGPEKLDESFRRCCFGR